MKKTIVFLKNRNDGSSYYRLYQYLKDKNNCRFIDITSTTIYRWFYNGSGKGILIKKMIMAAESILRVYAGIILDMLFWKSDIVIVNRKFFARKVPAFGLIILKTYLKNKTVYWDFDDNIIYDGEITLGEAVLLQKYSKSISVTNSFLKESLDQIYHNKIELLSTTDITFIDWNMEFITRMRLDKYQKKIKLIWLGTKNNLKYLENILPRLEECAIDCKKKFNKKLELTVVCNKFVEQVFENLVINNIRWNRDSALHELMNAHIGLMPLIEDTYTIGKGGFKAIQYIGAGLPALISNVGYNPYVINLHCGFLIDYESQWNESILFLANNEDMWKSYSYEARKNWQKSFSPEFHYKYWSNKCAR